MPDAGRSGGSGRQVVARGAGVLASRLAGAWRTLAGAAGGDADVIADGYDPRRHRRRFAALEGRGAGEPYLPPTLEWRQHAAPEGGSPTARFDVVVPVHTGLGDVSRCLCSVLGTANRSSFGIVVVDDATPDRDTRVFLDALARDGRVRLLRNETNLGFVASVNRGIRLHPDRDVVLLNADTCVFAGWLDRLAAHLDAVPDAGTVTPLSNAATILSYPIRLRDNHAPLECGAEALDALTARLALPPVPVPTAVGFCMAIRRRCLDQVGPFDAEAFGLGYGEENDFCLRATTLGWRHLAAADVFVWHRGGSSFGPRRDALREAAQAVLARRHPGYAATIGRFIASDPMRPCREAIDVARVRACGMRLRLGARAAGDARTLAALPDLPPYAGGLRILGGTAMPLPNLPRLDPAMPIEALAATLARLALRGIEIDRGDEGWGARLAAAARLASIPLRARN